VLEHPAFAARRYHRAASRGFLRMPIPSCRQNPRSLWASLHRPWRPTGTTARRLGRPASHRLHLEAHCKIVLCSLVTRDGSAPVPLHGAPDVSAGSIPEVVAGPQVELRANVTLLCRCSPERECPAEVSAMAIPTEGESVASRNWASDHRGRPTSKEPSSSPCLSALSRPTLKLSRRDRRRRHGRLESAWLGSTSRLIPEAILDHSGLHERLERAASTSPFVDVDRPSRVASKLELKRRDGSGIVAPGRT